MLQLQCSCVKMCKNDRLIASATQKRTDTIDLLQQNPKRHIAITYHLLITINIILFIGAISRDIPRRYYSLSCHSLPVYSRTYANSSRSFDHGTFLTEKHAQDFWKTFIKIVSHNF